MIKSQRIPLVGSLTNRLEAGEVVDDKDQTFINCFPVVTKNNLTGQGSVRLVKRFGYDLVSTVATSSYSSQNGFCVWSGSSTNYALFSVSDQTFGTTRVYDETGTIVGAGFNGYRCKSITETLISNVPTLVALVAANVGRTLTDAYYYQSGGAWTRIADGDFPTNQATPLQLAGEPVHKDGYMFVMDVNGTIWHSDLNSLANWTATSFIAADDEPDLGAGLAKSGSYIAAFGKRTIQFFQNTGNATGSVLSRVPLTLNIGVELVSDTGLRHIMQIADSVYFVGYNKKSRARHLYVMNGTNPVIISNAAVDELLNDASYTDGSPGHIAGVVTIHGMTHLMLTSYGPSYGQHYMYCIETGVWWRLYSDFMGSPMPACAGNFFFHLRKIYSMSTGYQDEGNTITMTVRTDPLDQGTTRRKFYQSAELIADTRTTSGNTSISWYDDDYTTESTARTIDLSTGQRRIYRLGSTKRNYNNKRAWKVTETVNAQFRGEALELWYEEGNN